MSENKVIKTVKITACVLWWTALVLIFALLVSIMSAKLKGEVPKVFGYSVLRIVSGSMEPTIPKDSYILVKEISAEDVKKDDIICFYSDDPQIYGFPNTHKVVEEPYIASDGDYRFVTRGERSLANDSVEARGERLIGKYQGELEFLGAFDKLLTGKAILIAVIAAESGVFVMALLSVLRAGRKKREKNDTEEDSSTR